MDHARARGKPRIIAEYLPTEKNKPTLDFLESAGLERDGRVYSFSTAQTYRAPDFIHVSCDDQAAH